MKETAGTKKNQTLFKNKDSLKSVMDLNLRWTPTTKYHIMSNLMKLSAVSPPPQLKQRYGRELDIFSY
jgi:hypothetical protein